MKTSQNGIKLIKKFESLHDGDLSIIGLQPKMCPAGIWTEGYGHAIMDPLTKKYLKGKKYKQRAYELSFISDPQIDDDLEADGLLQFDISNIEQTVNKFKFITNLCQNQYDAFISLVFNIGISNLLHINNGKPSTIYNLLYVDVNHAKIAEAFCMWVRVGDEYLRGLAKRRLEEATIYFK